MITLRPEVNDLGSDCDWPCLLACRSEWWVPGHPDLSLVLAGSVSIHSSHGSSFIQGNGFWVGSLASVSAFVWFPNVLRTFCLSCVISNLDSVWYLPSYLLTRVEKINRYCGVVSVFRVVPVLPATSAIDVGKSLSVSVFLCLTLDTCTTTDGLVFLSLPPMSSSVYFWLFFWVTRNFAFKVGGTGGDAPRNTSLS